MRKRVESFERENDLVWVINDQEFMSIKDKRWFKLSWIGLKLTDSEKANIIRDQLIFESDAKIEYLLKKTSLNKIKLDMEKRFKTSYTDIMIKIVTMHSKIKLEPLYGTYEDYDSYNERLGYCIERVVKAYENKYGRF